jgi:hypothetical protein
MWNDRRTVAVVVGLLAVLSLGASGYLYWLSTGPVLGDIRVIDDGAFLRTQRVDRGPWGQTRWVDQQMAPK